MKILKMRGTYQGHIEEAIEKVGSLSKETIETPFDLLIYAIWGGTITAHNDRKGEQIVSR